jgi:MFS family permease
MNAISLSRRVALVTFVGGLGGGLVFPILPALGLRLGIPGLMIGFILSANRISRLIFDSPAGHIVDRLGGRITLSGALLIETLGVLGYSAALHFGNPAWWLLAGRAVYGIGSAFLLIGAMATVLSVTTRADRGRRTATVRVAMSSGMPAGLILGGLIADLFSDDAAFLTGAGLTFIGAMLAAALIRTPRADPRHAPKQPLSPRRLGTLFASPNFSLIAASWGFNFLVFLTMQGVVLATLVVLVQFRDLHLFGLKAQGTAGLVMAALMTCSSVMALIIGRSLDRVRLRSTLLVPALAGLAAGFAVLAFADTLWLLFVGVVIVGLSYNGIGLPMLALLGDVTHDQHGRAVGIYQVFGDIGGSIGPIVGLEAGINVGLLPLYLGIAVLPALAIFAALWLRRREREVHAKGWQGRMSSASP